MARYRVAIAHDYLTQRGGAERVVMALARAFPEAPVYTTLYDPRGTYPEFAGLDVRTSALDRVGPLRRNHRAALPFLPLASGSMNIDADVVIASSSGWAHGCKTTGKKLVYCYTPARWLYEKEAYLGSDATTSARAALGLLSPILRQWDARAAAGADEYLAISTVVRDRIQRVYGRVADVVPPPSGIAAASNGSADRGRIPDDGFFLVVSRLMPYKNVHRVVEAFREARGQRLVVIGAGPDGSKLRASAPSHIQFLENATDAEMAAAYRGCRALIAASFEDFGLTPLEAAAAGKPTAALRAGGYLDTIVEGQTGLFFDQPDPEAIRRAVDAVVAREWNASDIMRHSESFSEERFANELRRRVDRLCPSSGTAEDRDT